MEEGTTQLGKVKEKTVLTSMVVEQERKGGMSKGIGSFIKKKGLQPRSEGGQYMSPKGLKDSYNESIMDKRNTRNKFLSRVFELWLKKVW